MLIKKSLNFTVLGQFNSLDENIIGLLIEINGCNLLLVRTVLIWSFLRIWSA
jgi:hypothetical protein